MADYKRKKVKKGIFSSQKKKIDNSKITMSENNSGVVPQRDIRVVRGAKLKRKEKVKILSVFIAFICIFCIILSLLSPTGLYENITNFAATFGHGTYPCDISGNVVINVVSNNSYYYVLTDTNVMAFSNNGKLIFDDFHGFSNPVLSVSEMRAIVYDQGGKSVHVYNLKGRIDTIHPDKEIITSSITKNGSIALVTHSDSYTSVVTVYNKNLDVVYTWNSAKDIINGALVSNNGKKLAVTTLSVVSGKYVSKLHILSFDSADPVHSIEFNDSIALALANNGNGLSVFCNNKYKYLHWSNHTTNEITASGEINLFRVTKKGVLLTFNRANDRNDNTIILVSKKGEKISDFDLQTSISDIQYNKGRIYLLCDTTINIFDKGGNILRCGNCDYDIKKIAVTSANSVATVSDNKILKINIESGEE